MAFRTVKQVANRASTMRSTIQDRTANIIKPAEKKLEHVVNDKYFRAAQLRQATAFDDNKTIKQQFKARLLDPGPKKGSNKTFYGKAFYTVMIFVYSLGLIIEFYTTPKEMRSTNFHKEMLFLTPLNIDGDPMGVAMQSNEVMFSIGSVKQIWLGGAFLPINYESLSIFLKIAIISQENNFCFTKNLGNLKLYAIGHSYLHILNNSWTQTDFPDCLNFESIVPGLSLDKTLTSMAHTLKRKAVQVNRVTVPCNYGFICTQTTPDQCKKTGGRPSYNVDVCQQLNVYENLSGTISGKNVALTNLSRIFVSAFISPGIIAICFGFCSIYLCSMRDANKKFPFMVIFFVYFMGGYIGISWTVFFFPGAIGIGFIYSFIAIEGLEKGSICMSTIVIGKASWTCFIFEVCFGIVTIGVIIIVVFFNNSNPYGAFVAFLFGIMSAGWATTNISSTIRIYSFFSSIGFIVITIIIIVSDIAPRYSDTICQYKYSQLYCLGEQFGVVNRIGADVDNSLLTKVNYFSMSSVIKDLGYGEILDNLPNYMREFRSRSFILDRKNEKEFMLEFNIDRFKFYK